MKLILRVFRNALLCSSLFMVAGINQAASGENDIEQKSFDWPQWRGPKRDGKSEETGLIRKFSKKGLEVLWRRELGTAGYSGISVVGEYVYTMYSEGDYEYAVCLDAETGAQVWLFVADRIFLNQYGRGPRSTPTVDGDRVYIMSARGTLYCLEAIEKKRIWDVVMGEFFSGGVPRWGCCASPIIDGDKLLLEIGTPTRNVITAFDKYDGTIKWKTYTDDKSYVNDYSDISKDRPAYASPVSMQEGGQKQTIFFTASQVISLSSEGRVNWRYPWQTRYGANVASPVITGDGKVFISSGYNKGCALLQVSTSDGISTVKEVWKNRVMRNSFSSSVHHEGYLYGFDMRILKCVDAATGEQMWRKSGFGSGSLIYADGQLIVLAENGDLALIEASAKKFKQKARAKVFHKGKCWTAPTLANGQLYLRNQFELICLNFKKN